MPIMVVGLVGLKGAGKSVVADAFVGEKQNDSIKTAFAAPLKAGLRAMFGFTEAQLHDAVLKEALDERYGITPRQAMQVVGTELMRHELERRLGVQGLWIKRMDEVLTQAAAAGKHVIVEDVRFPDELECIARHGGTIVRVTRPALQAAAAQPEGEPSAAAAAPPGGAVHETESYVLPHAHELVNSGSIEELRDKARKLMLQLNKSV
jgi:hypothetical protein